MVDLDLDPVFAEQLQQLHGPVLQSALPASLLDASMLRVRLPLSISAAIYSAWTDALASHQANALADSSVSQGTHFSRAFVIALRIVPWVLPALNPEEFPTVYESHPEYQEKMDEEYARMLHEAEMVTPTSSQSPSPSTWV